MSRSLLPALMVMIGVLAAGCGDASEPASAAREPARAATPATAPVGPPAAAGLSEPVMPDAALTEDEAGAEAFVTYYWEIVEYAERSGDIETLTDLAAGTCRPYARTASSLAATGSDAPRIASDRIATVAAEVIQRDRTWDVTGRIRIRDYAMTSGDGHAFTVRGGVQRFAMTLAFDGAWQVTELSAP